MRHFALALCLLVPAAYAQSTGTISGAVLTIKNEAAGARR
jgi:hypothetical protein